MSITQPDDIYGTIPLKSSGSSIRLIDLDRLSDGRISCNLRVVDLSQKPRFVALSYAWGAPQPTRDILLNGHHFTIRENLWHGLNSILLQTTQQNDLLQQKSRRWSGRWFGPKRDRISGMSDLRHCLQMAGFADEKPLLWIDQLSINQSNYAERNHQVGIMKTIYSDCSAALVWLGAAGEESDLSFAFLQSKRQALPSAQARESLEKLCSRLYWTRLWVVQETILPPSCVLLCGTRAVSYKVFCTFLKELFEKTVETEDANIMSFAYALAETPAAALVNVQNTLTLAMREARRPILLDEVIRLCRGQHCLDVKDKIYAVLSLGASALAGMNTASHISVDYSKSDLQLYCECLLAIPTKDMNPERLRRYSRLLGETLKVNIYSEEAVRDLRRALFLVDIRKHVNARLSQEQSERTRLEGLDVRPPLEPQPVLGTDWCHAIVLDSLWPYRLPPWEAPNLMKDLQEGIQPSSDASERVLTLLPNQPLNNLLTWLVDSLLRSYWLQWSRARHTEIPSIMDLRAMLLRSETLDCVCRAIALLAEPLLWFDGADEWGEYKPMINASHIKRALSQHETPLEGSSAGQENLKRLLRHHGYQLRLEGASGRALVKFFKVPPEYVTHLSEPSGARKRDSQITWK